MKRRGKEPTVANKPVSAADEVVGGEDQYHFSVHSGQTGGHAANVFARRGQGCKEKTV